MSDIDRRQARRAFARAAPTYDEGAILQRTIADQLIGRLQWLRVTPRVVVDIGTGTGYCLPLLRHAFPQAIVAGLDLALPMLITARRRCGWWWRRSPLVAADGCQLPFANASIDGLVSNLALQWMDISVAFLEFRRVLRPGGFLLFSTFGPDTLKELRAAWAIVDGHPHIHHFVDMHDVGDALVQAGFAEPVLDVDHFTLTYADAQSALADLKRIGAHNVSAGRFAALTGRHRFARFLAAYEETRRDGRLPLTYEVVFGQAWAASPAGDTVRVPVTAIGGRRRL
ncbi:MAG: malonyl-ACP O-methyltransferase BioC [Acidiferrobacter sp.]